MPRAAVWYVAVLAVLIPYQAATGWITGTVIDGTTRAPIPAATVTVLLGPNLRPVPRRPSQTSADGRFFIGELPRGQYVVMAQADGYANGYNGELRPGDSGRSVTVTDGQRADDVVIQMWKSATIDGSVTDDLGRPVAGATVEARSRSAQGYGARFGVPRLATTDASGRYRFGNLSPGAYLVAVLFTATTIPGSVLDDYRQALSLRSERGQELIAKLTASMPWIPVGPGPRIGANGFQVVGPDGPVPIPASEEGKLLVYQTTFYRTASTARAAEIVRVASGEVRSGTDFRLARRPTVRVSGVVTGPDGPGRYVGLRLVAPDEPPVGASEFISLTSFENAVTTTDVEGRFTFLGVPAGSYSVLGSPAGSTPWVKADVSVGDVDVTGLVLTLHPGIRVSGRVEFDGDPPPPDVLARASIARLGRLQPTGYAGPQGVSPDASGSFTTPGYPPGRYLVLSQPIGSWILRSAMSHGRDVSLLPLELTDTDVTGLVLTYTNRRTLLHGTVHPGPGDAPSSIEVIVFPAGYSSWLQEGLPSHLPSRQMRVVHAADTGSFVISGLAPGEYLVAAFNGEDGGEPSAEFLAHLARVATPVSLRDGENTAVELSRVAIR